MVAEPKLETRPSETTGAAGKGVPAGIWRLHFWAALFAAPLIVLSCLTGILYVFHPQVEAVLYRDQLRVASVGQTRPFAALVEAAQAAVPGGRLTSLTVPGSPDETVSFRFAVSGKGNSSGGEHAEHMEPKGGAKEARLVYVDPYTAKVTGTANPEDQFGRVLKLAHKNFLLSDVGRCLTELGTSWAMFLVLSGLYLWWPKTAAKRAQWRKQLRIRTGSERARRRDLHVVVGVLAFGVTSVLLFTGLTWSQYAGNYRRSFQKAIGQEGLFRARPPASTDGGEPLGLDALVGSIHKSGVPVPFQIDFGRDSKLAIKVTNPDEVSMLDAKTAFFDRASGRPLKSLGWNETPFWAKVFSAGVKLHEGTLFGFANQLLSAFGAGLILWSTLTGLGMWWKRRPSGSFGTPAWGTLRLPVPMALVLIGLGIAMPLFGISLLLFAATELAFRLRSRSKTFLPS